MLDHKNKTRTTQGTGEPVMWICSHVLSKPCTLITLKRLIHFLVIDRTAVFPVVQVSNKK